MKPHEQESHLTTGQISRRTGLTLRTLRYYDQIGLLRPSLQGPGSRRLYSTSDMIRLQKIQTLKYIGLPLQDIQQMIDGSSRAMPEQDLWESLSMQREILLQKAAHLQYVLKAVNEAAALLEHQDEVDWLRLAALIQAADTERDWTQQYQTARRLQTRMDLYDRFGVNPTPWHHWFFAQLGTSPALSLLELGCGDGALWAKNLDRIPPSWNITLTDVSAGMLSEARRHLPAGDVRFKYLMADAQDIPFHPETFDVVVAGHMLYHVPDIPKALAEIHRVLKPGGLLLASTMSRKHLQEMELLAAAFDPQIRVLDPVMHRFELGCAHELLAERFAEAELLRYENQLAVNEVEPLLNYMTSTPMNAREILSGEKQTAFRQYLEQLLERDGPLIVTSDSGCYRARK